MKCMYCQATMERGKNPFDIDRKDFHLRFNNIPAWICPQCGESYFEEQDVDAIQKVIESVDNQLRNWAVPA